MWANFLDVLRELAGSKKFLVLITGLIVAGAAKLGLHLDDQTVAEIVGLFAAWLIGQGVADHGKEAAKINAATAIMSGNQDPANDNARAASFRAALKSTAA